MHGQTIIFVNMQLLLKKILSVILVFVVFFSISCMAQARFTASISPTVIGKDEIAELTFIVENALQFQLVSLPSLQNFTIVSGPNKENGMERINGNMREYTLYTFTIKPRLSGNFTIGEATARADGKLLQTKPVTLKVTKKLTGNTPSGIDPFAGLSPFEPPAPVNTYNDFIIREGEDIKNKIKQNIFIKVQTDKTTCFIGEPIVVTYKLYTRLKCESNIIKSPSLSGFSVIDLSSPSYENFVQEILDGRMYNVFILRRAQLYPLQAGPVTLETVSVENNLTFLKAAFIKNNNIDDYIKGAFNQDFPQEAILNEKVTLHSKPVNIMVKALPAADSAGLYSGAVGDFFIHSWVDKSSFTSNETGNLHVNISGAGNLTLVNAPEIKWPTGIENFEAVVKDTFNRFSVPVTGSITYNIPFTVNKAGSYVLSPIIFTFFNAGSGTYKTIKTQPIVLTITKGTGKKIMANEAVFNRYKYIVEAVFNNRWMIIVPIVLLIITGLLFWLQMDKKKIAQNGTAIFPEKNGFSVVPNNHLSVDFSVVNPFEQSKAMLQQQDARQFYKTLHKELLLLLANKLNLGNDNYSKKNIEKELGKSGILLDETPAIQQLLNEIELQLYTPFADEIHQQVLYDQAMHIAERLQKY